MSALAETSAEQNRIHPASLGQVTIVHDYLNQRGGAEKVVLELADMWPDAPIYTSFYRPQSTFPEFDGRDIRTTVLNRLPMDNGFRNLFPLYPAAFRSLGELSGDVVIASSSGWAHMARVAPEVLHVVYCHTPARWLYRSDYLQGAERRSWREAAIRPATRAFRALDRRAARRADLYSLTARRRANEFGLPTASIPPSCTRRWTSIASRHVPEASGCL